MKINHSVLTRRIDELYADAQVCAQVADLAYVSDNEPGIVRQRRGRGFSFRDAGNRPLTDREVKARILARLSHRRGAMCGSAPTRTGTSWPSEWTTRGASNTSIMSVGASFAICSISSDS